MTGFFAFIDNALHQGILHFITHCIDITSS